MRKKKPRVRPSPQSGCLVRVQHSYGGRGFNPGDLGILLGDFREGNPDQGFRVMDLARENHSWDLPNKYIHVVTLEPGEEWL